MPGEALEPAVHERQQADGRDHRQDSCAVLARALGGLHAAGDPGNRRLQSRHDRNRARGMTLARFPAATGSSGMNDDEWDNVETDRDGAEEALEAIRRAERVDFALRITQSLQGAGRAPRPLAIAFQQTVSRVVPPEARAQREASGAGE